MGKEIIGGVDSHQDLHTAVAVTLEVHGARKRRVS